MTSQLDPKKDPERRCLKLERWPEADRLAWNAAVTPGNLLDPGGLARRRSGRGVGVGYPRAGDGGQRHVVEGGMIETAENVRREYSISRADQDELALRSHQRAVAAQQDGTFAEEIVPVHARKQQLVIERDEHPRADTTLESLAGLQPAFLQMAAQPMGPNGETLDQLALKRYPETKQIEHVHTAGNSSGIVDGAAVVLLGSAAWGKAAAQKPRAKIRAMATAGAEPLIMLTAPAPASQKALKKAGMTVKDIDLWEINEAFAVVPLQTARTLGIDPDKINVNGGSIALGHPLGATGAILLGTVLDELERTNKATALITLCIGGGMGIATIIERV